MKKLTKIAVAVALAAILCLLLYAQIFQASKEQKVQLADVVVVKREIAPGEKIAKEDVELQSKRVPAEMSKNYFGRIEDVENKYAKDRIYEGSFVHVNSIKSTEEKKLPADIREIRIATNVAAYAGVGKGDKVDLIYVDKMGALDTVGKIIVEGLEVKAVLNSAGQDLEKVEADKYNQVSLEPSYVVFWLDQKLALEIGTLQGTTTDIVFKLAKWTDDSEEIKQNPGVKTKDAIIFGKTQAPAQPSNEPPVKIGGGD